MLKAITWTVLSGTIALLSVSQSLAQNKPTCAVLTFDARVGLSVGEAQSLSDRFAVEFDRLGRYTIVARSMMREILDEQEFQATDHCSAAACAVEAGQILGVRYMVYGTITRLGNIYSVNSFMVDVETGAQIRSATTDMDGDIGQALTYLMSANAHQLLGMEPPPRPDAPPRRPPEPRRDPEGYFNISLSPARAKLRLNDQDIRQGFTPVEPDRDHILFASRSGYVNYRQRHRVASGETRDIDIRLQRERISGSWFIGPRLGASIATGIAGIEIQYRRVSICTGYAEGGNLAIGAKYYLRYDTHSWYIGGGHATFENSNVKDSFSGALLGYHWRWKSGISLTLGSGAGRQISEQRHKTTETWIPMFDLAIGYSF